MQEGILQRLGMEISLERQEGDNKSPQTVNESNKSPYIEHTTKDSGGHSSDPDRPLSPTCTDQNTDLSTVISFQKQQARKMQNLFAEFSSIKDTMTQLPGARSDNSEDGEATRGGISPEIFQDDQSGIDLGQGQNSGGFYFATMCSIVVIICRCERHTCFRKNVEFSLNIDGNGSGQ